MINLFVQIVQTSFFIKILISMKAQV